MSNSIFNSEYLSRDTTEHLKGYLAIAVLLHHIFQKTDLISHDSILGFFCQSVGYYCVSMFLFISGYGLMCSYNCRGGYLTDYQRNRVFPIFVINGTLVVIYGILKCCLGYDLSWTNIALSFFYGGNIVSNGWYLLCIMLFYEIFYIVAKYKPDNIPFYVLLVVLLYIVIAIKMPSWYIVSSLAFPFGLYYSYYKSKIDDWLETNFRFAFSCFLMAYMLCFGGLFILQTNIDSVLYSNRLIFILNLFHGVLFCCVIILLLAAGATAPKSRNMCARILSQYYLELYVTQGIAFILLRNSKWNVENDLIYSISSIFLSFVFAFLIHPVFQMINTIIKKK